MMEMQIPTDFRSQRGLALAQTKRDAIKPIVGTKWLVPSATSTGGYVVDTQEGTCSCPDWIKLGGHGQPHRCKHIWAAILIVRLPDGISVIVEERTQYDRDWRAINWARTAIPRLGPALIVELVDGLGLEPPVGGKRGAPRVPESDILKVALLRTFEEKTAGEAEVAAENYQTLGLQIDRVPSYNTLLREFARPSFMPHYHRLLAGSSLACIGLEDTFAVDGTAFGTSRFDCHRTHKHGTKTQKLAEEQRHAEIKHHRWIEAKLVFGVDTLIIPAGQITAQHVSEGPLMQELLRRTIANGGRVTTWCGDAAYLSWYNIEAVERVGGKPFFDFPKGVTGKTRPAVRRLYEQFLENKEAYWREYGKRSLAESGNQALKERFGHYLRSRTPNAQYAECMLRCICHNIARTVQAVQEFKVHPKFWANAITERADFGSWQP